MISGDRPSYGMRADQRDPSSEGRVAENHPLVSVQSGRPSRFHDAAAAFAAPFLLALSTPFLLRWACADKERTR